MATASKDLKPYEEGMGSMFLKSQLTRQPKWSLSSTHLEGRVAIVSGANSGLGFESARQLLSYGLSRLILAVRSQKSGEAAAAGLKRQYPKATIEVWMLDMLSYESIQAFARRADAELSRLDIVILNAGGTPVGYQKVEATGHENTIQLNYISTTLLAILLLPILKAKSTPGEPGHLSMVGSGTAYAAKFPNRGAVPLLASFDDVEVLPFDPVERYWVSKLLGHFILPKLASYVDPKDVIVNIVDPGLTKGTALNKSSPPLISVIMWLMKALFGRTMETGASTYIDATVIKGKESHGSFVADWEIAPFAAMCYTPEGQVTADRLWDETMAELKFAGAQEILDGLNKAM